MCFLVIYLGILSFTAEYNVRSKTIAFEMKHEKMNETEGDLNIQVKNLKVCVCCHVFIES